MDILDTSRPFRTWLKEQRKLSGLTQQQLAKHINCTVSLIQKLESGARTPSMLIARKIAQTFEINSADYPLFITWSVEAPETPPTIPPHVPYPIAAPLSISPRLIITSELIGRQSETAWIETFLREQHGRLLTLVGPAGVGKTSLALAVGNNLQQTYKTIKIDLDSVENSELVLMTISQKLGLGGTSESVIQAAFQHMIGDETLLLIIDTFEHVLEAASSIQAILNWCPNILLLITSQAPLRLDNERVYQLEPLGVPKQDITTLQELEDSQAGNLLLERLRKQRCSWNIIDSEAAGLAHICRYLDGIPLAIELIAARLRWIKPQRLLEYLETDYSMAQRPLAASPQRHQSLNNAIQRSYELLPTQAQDLFCCLSIFADGWSLAEAYTIYTKQPAIDTNFTEQQHFAELIEMLRERGLILPLATNVERFRMLRALRLFGQQLFTGHASDKLHLVQKLHSECYLEVAEQLSKHEDNAVWHNHMTEILANSMQAIQWNIAQGHGEQAGRIALSYATYWYRNQAWREANYWFGCITNLRITHQKVALDVKRWYANTCQLLKDYHTAVEQFFSLLKSYEQNHDWAGMHATLNSLGLGAIVMGNYVEAWRYFYSAYHLAEQHNLSMRYAIYNNLGFLAQSEGLYHEAIEIYQSYCPVIEQLSHVWIKAQYWISFSQTYLAINQRELASEMLDRATTINNELNSARFSEEILRIRIYIAVANGQREEALRVAQQLQVLVVNSENHTAIVLSILASVMVCAAFDKWEIVAPIVIALRHWIERRLISLCPFEQGILSELEQRTVACIGADRWKIFQHQGRLIHVEYALMLTTTTLAVIEI